MKIYVGKKDIAKAETIRELEGTRFFAPSDCPVAQAVKRKTNATYIAVSGRSVCINDKNYALSPTVRDRIMNWDDGVYMEPFTFTIGNYHED